jgi:ribose transport system substrate-binding protein
MKRVLSILVVVMLLVGIFAGCKGSTTSDAKTGEPEKSPSEATSSDPGTSGQKTGDGLDPESYDFPEFYQQSAGEYFKGILMKEDFLSRAHINKGLPAKGETKSDLVIGFAANTMDNSYFVLLADSCKAAAEEYGYKLNVVCYEGNVNRMTTVIEDFVTQKVDAIIVDPLDMASAAVAVEKAAAAGIPTVAIGQPMPADSAIVTSIHPSYYNLSYRNAYDMVKDCFDADTEMVIGSIMGVPTWHTWSLAYMTGAYAARMEQMGTPVTKEEAMVTCYDYYIELFDKGSIEIPEAKMRIPAYIAEGGFAQEGGMAACEALISAIPDMNCIFSINDFNAIGAIMALENNSIVPGKDVYIVAACDGSTEGVEVVRDGKLYATANQCPEWQAKAALKLIHDIFEEGFDANDLCAHTLVPEIVINQDNWEDYYVEGALYAPSSKEEVVFKTTAEAFADFVASQQKTQ